MWSSDGKVELGGRYSQGLKEGKWAEWGGDHDRPAQLAKGRYRAGKRIGKWDFFTADGKRVLREQDFSKGF